jgi:ABC-type transport system involved in cytochrome bd biosynthesis fused ATPase/permease subunit
VRTIVKPAELPLGVLTAFIGVPLFWPCCASSGARYECAPRLSSLECRNLGVGVAKGPRLATVDVRIQAGRFTAILGPNGAGKSTLMSMLVGERAPQSGQVLLDGLELSGHAVEGLRAALRHAPGLQRGL